MSRTQSFQRTATPIQPVRGTTVHLAPGGSPYRHLLPGPDAPRVLDLFCGAGGLSLGFAMAGFHTAGGVDADAHAMETHAYNFGGNHQPIVLTESNSPQAVLTELGIEHVDVLIGGPPCQGFARVGRGKIRSLRRQELTEEELRDWEDPRNRLYRAYLRFVEILQPRAVVMENVPDMARHNQGAVVESILTDLAALGYNARAMVLNASHFGVPQTRQRLFIVGNNFGAPVSEPVPTTLHRPVTVRQAISDLPPLRPEDSTDEMHYRGPARSSYARLMRGWLTGKERRVVYDHVVRCYAGDDQEAFHFLGEGGRFIDLPPRLQRYRDDVFDDKYHKLYWDRPSWTITAHIAKDGYKYIYPDPDQLRTLSAREAARIQSFPDWFRFAGFRTQRLKQIGNAVPPLLAKAIGQMVMDQLREYGALR